MIISDLCFLFQGDSFVFPVTLDIKGVMDQKDQMEEMSVTVTLSEKISELL